MQKRDPFDMWNIIGRSKKNHQAYLEGFSMPYCDCCEESLGIGDNYSRTLCEKCRNQGEENRILSEARCGLELRRSENTFVPVPKRWIQIHKESQERMRALTCGCAADKKKRKKRK